VEFYRLSEVSYCNTYFIYYQFTFSGKVVFSNCILDVLHGTIPLNVYAIIYERVRTFRITSQYENLLVLRTIFCIWSLAVLGSIPSLVSYGFEQDQNGNGYGVCKKVKTG